MLDVKQEGEDTCIIIIIIIITWSIWTVFSVYLMYLSLVGLFLWITCNFIISACSQSMLIFHIIYHHLLIAMGKDLVSPAALKSDVCFLSLVPLILRPGVGVDHLPCSSLLLAECSPFSLSKTLLLKLLAAEHAALLCVAAPLPGTTPHLLSMAHCCLSAMTSVKILDDFSICRWSQCFGLSVSWPLFQ